MPWTELSPDPSPCHCLSSGRDDTITSKPQHWEETRKKQQTRPTRLSNTCSRADVRTAGCSESCLQQTMWGRQDLAAVMSQSLPEGQLSSLWVHLPQNLTKRKRNGIRTHHFKIAGETHTMNHTNIKGLSVQSPCAEMRPFWAQPNSGASFLVTNAAENSAQLAVPRSLIPIPLDSVHSLFGVNF